MHDMQQGASMTANCSICGKTFAGLTAPEVLKKTVLHLPDHNYQEICLSGINTTVAMLWAVVVLVGKGSKPVDPAIIEWRDQNFERLIGYLRPDQSPVPAAPAPDPGAEQSNEKKSESQA